MAVALDVAAGTLVTTSTNLISVSLTVAANSNRGLVLLIGNESTLTVSGVAFTAGSGGTWAQLGSVNDGGNLGLAIWSCIAPSTGSITVQATMSGNNTLDLNAILYSVYNADQTTLVDGYVSNITGVATISTTLSSGGMVIGHDLDGGDPGAIITGTEDYSAINNAAWRGAHNSASGTITWTNTGNVLDICNVRQAVSGVIPSTGAYQQEQSLTDRYQLEDGSGVYLIEPWGQVAVSLPPFIQGDLTGIGAPGRFFKDRLN